MGLDTSHDAFHGPYSAFMQLRIWIADKCGIDLIKMEGFGGEAPISWDTVNDDISILLYHSDCDGDISPQDCGKLAARLKTLLASCEPEGGPYSQYHRAVQFMKGCMAAHAAGEVLDFH